jgi:glyoxylase-like metal-dependent hydrolase (beta-lactamase superfamily II)
MLKHTVRTVAALLLAAATFAQKKAAPPPKASKPAPSASQAALSPHAPKKLAEGVWAMMTTGGANAGWFTFGDSVIAVDSGKTAEDGEAVLAAITQTTGKKSVSYLIVTNDFGPHAGGAAVFVRQGATIVCQENFVEEFQKVPPESRKPSTGVKAATMVLGVSNRLVFARPDRHVVVRHLGPADSRGDLGVLLVEDKILFSGDLVESYLLPPLLSKSIQPEGWLSALTLLSRQSPKAVVPGYGPIGPPGAIAATRDYLEHTLAVAQTIVRDKTPDDFIPTRIDEPDLQMTGLPDELKKSHEANVKALVAWLKTKPAGAPAPEK